MANGSNIKKIDNFSLLIFTPGIDITNMKHDYPGIRHLWQILTFFIVTGMILNSCKLNVRKITEADWPQYKKDNFRSANTNVQLNLSTLGQAWVHEAPQYPAPAWYGPAKEDAFALSGPLPSMRDYDLSYYPVVVGTKLYYGSSSDDALHCLDASTGEQQWIYTTGGPIRIAPTYDNGFLYFGSDDGYVYCLHSSTGKLQWKYSPSLKGFKKVLNNGRLISFWPVRTGILIEDGIAYFGASMLPWKKSYICAVNIESGKTDIPGTYVRAYDDMTLEGAMASTGSMLIQPQGRISPIFVKKNNGEKAGQLAGTGGCFVLVTPDKHVVHGHTSRHKSIRVSAIEKRPEFITFKDGKEMVVKGDTSYVLSDKSIAAYHRITKKLIWLRRNYQAHRMVIAGDALFVGATDTVYAVSIANGLPLWKGNVEGTVYALTIANNAMYASTGEGKIFCFQDGIGNSGLLAGKADNDPGIDTLPEKESGAPNDPVLNLKSGPFVHALSIDSVNLQFETREQTIVNVAWKTLNNEQIIKGEKAMRRHQFKLPVRKNFNYNYRLISANGEVAQFEYDNFFNYKPKKREMRKYPKSKAACDQDVAEFINSYRLGLGLCLVIGRESNQTAYDLAAQTSLKVIKIGDSPRKIEKFRKLVQENGVYGAKISGLEVEDVNRLPVNSEIADLVWVNKGDEFKADEIIRIIAPNKFALVNGIDNKEQWLKDSELCWQVEIKNYSQNSLILKKNPIENRGSWTHQYAHTNNSSFGGESLWGSTSTEDFEVQWMGRPGPRFQTDRSGRKPSPLAVNGKLFVQGNERVIAVNVYNGTIYWAKNFAGLKRMNVLRDCSNWAADEAYLYMAIDDKLLKVNQQDGAVVSAIPADRFQTVSSNWSYIAVLKDQLIGSTSATGARFNIYHGGIGWYDFKSGPLSYKVLSNNLFSLTKEGEGIWEYRPRGAVINPTITVAEGQVSFVETRSANSESLKSGRGGDEIYQNTWLVALNEMTGELLWERRVITEPGRTAYFMASGSGKYIVVASNDGMYDIQAFLMEGGRISWKKKQEWFHGDHGAHMSKPAIVGNRLMVKPALYHLDTGEQIDYNVPKAGHGCAHYALSEQSVFYRGGSVTQFNFDTRNFSKWERLRPDCWISTIPAEGMVLSPEAGGGCSCGNWLETSMVLAPVSRAPITIKSLGETSKLDYKNEKWSDFSQTSNFDKFTDSLFIELTVKEGIEGELRYTIDGSQADKNSLKYSTPFLIDKTTVINATLFITKGGRERKFARKQQFTKI